MSWRIEGVIILIITITVCSCVLMVFLASIVFNRPITEEGGRAVSNILLVMLGMISGYVAKAKVDKIKKKRKER